jgi:hypothetical protein
MLTCSTTERATPSSGPLLPRELHLSYIANNFFNIYPNKLITFLLESPSIGLYFKKRISLVSLL